MPNTAKLLFFIVVFLFTPPIHADFYSKDSVDDVLGEKRTKRYTKDVNGNSLRLGVLCKEVSSNLKILGITFDSDNYIAQAREMVRLNIKVDDGIAYPLYGYMGTLGFTDRNSTNNGWAERPSEQLLNELRTGKAVRLTVYNDSFKIEGQFSLSGAKSAIDDVVAACD